MLRGFLLIFVLAGIVIVALFGFRGEHSTGTPMEIFPDMVRQHESARAGAARIFSPMAAAPRVPIAGTVPIGYEMPKPQTMAHAGNAERRARGRRVIARRSVSASGTDYYNTGKMGTNWGTGIPVQVTPQLMQRGQQRFNITCAMCHGADRGRQRHRKAIRPRHGRHSAGRAHSENGGRRNFQHHHQRQEHHDGVRP